MNTTKLIATYGNPGSGAAPDPAWVKANIIYCGGGGKAERPAMPGVPTRFWFAVHRLVEPRMRRAFAAAKVASSDYKIATAGCFVFRHQRHDPRRPLSNHSWGVAVDIDAPANGGRYIDAPPAPWSPAWRKLWPNGLPQAFVEAFEDEGFAWGGRWKGFCDPMHFESRT